MAMYYYARKLQKARRPKTPPPSQVTGAGTTGNGVIPNSVPTVAPPNNVSSPSTSSGSTMNEASSRTHVTPAGLVYQDSRLVGGSFEALIEHLVPTETYYPDRAYTFAFLLASRLIGPPAEVLGRVSCHALSPSNPPLSYKGEKDVSHMIQLLGEWTQLFPYDFRDERMMAHVRSITEKCVSADSQVVREEVSHLLTTLLGRLTALERHEAFLHRMTTETALAAPLSAPSILTICPSPALLAQQLTHIELDRLAHIGPEEFIQVGLVKEVPAHSTAGPIKKTRNLEAHLQWHHRLSFYVATEICKVPKKRLRVRVIEHWIQTATECFNIRNFNSLMAIIMAFNMSPVERLKKTWNKTNSSQLVTLDEHLDPYNNFVSYRVLLQSLAAGGGPGPGDERQKVVIPFMSLLVKDLCVLSQEAAAKCSGGRVPFDKFWEIGRRVTEFMGWQKSSCPFPKLESVISSLQTLPVFAEAGFQDLDVVCDIEEVTGVSLHGTRFPILTRVFWPLVALFRASYACEPPYSPPEKDHLRSLVAKEEEPGPGPQPSTSSAPPESHGKEK